MILKQHKLEPVECMEYKPLYEVGTAILTTFGPATITNYRAHDGMYEVVVENKNPDKNTQCPIKMYISGIYFK